MNQPSLITPPVAVASYSSFTPPRNSPGPKEPSAAPLGQLPRGFALLLIELTGDRWIYTNGSGPIYFKGVMLNYTSWGWWGALVPFTSVELR